MVGLGKGMLDKSLKPKTDMRKSLTSHIAAMALLLMAVVGFASCSDSVSDLINYVPKETKAVLVFKPQDIATKGNLEKLLKQIPTPSNKDNKAALSFFKDCLNGDSGIDMEQMVLFEYENDAYLSFIVSDFDKFDKLEVVEDNFTKSKIEGLEAYEGDGQNIIADGKKVWLCSGKDVNDCVENVKMFTGLDKDKSVMSVNGFEANMSGGDLNAFVNMEEIMAMGGGMGEQAINRELSRYGISASDLKLKDIYNSYLFTTATFEKDKMTVKVKMLDEEGNNVVSKIIGDKTIDIEMLKHFDKSTTLVYATVLPDYVKKMYAAILENNVYDEMQKGIIEEIFKNLDDNVAIGVSLSDNLMCTDTTLWGDVSQRLDRQAVGMTLVAKCKKDLGPEVATLGSFMNLDIAEDGSVTLPVSYDFAVRIKADGNYVVVSNRQAPVQPLADPGVFKGRASAMFVNLAKGSTASRGISKAFGIDLDLTAISYSDKNDNAFVLKVNDNKQENVLAYLIELVMKVSRI